jgi:hypothetical protein
MSHDASKVLLGATRSSFKVVDNRAGSIAAGMIVRLKSDDTISIALADGNPLGISLGKDLSDISRTAICRKGKAVPVLLTDAFTPTKGAQVNFSDTTGLAIASGAGATAVNAIYVTGVITGIKEDGTTANVALIDFPGGL